MSHTTTTELGLRKDGADEAIVNFRGVTNDNLDIIDSAYGQSLDNVASVEGSTASTNHAVGTYLIQNGTLYRVTSAIASGETITPGTNVTATTLNDAVVSLNSAIATLQDSVSGFEDRLSFHSTITEVRFTAANGNPAIQYKMSNGDIWWYVIPASKTN